VIYILKTNKTREDYKKYLVHKSHIRKIPGVHMGRSLKISFFRNLCSWYTCIYRTNSLENLHHHYPTE